MYSKGTLKEHIKHVKKVLQKIQEYCLLLYLDECKFYVTKIDYLRFIISKDSVAIDLKKIATVQE